MSSTPSETLRYGANSQSLSLCGKTVEDVRESASVLLNIPSDASARVNGEEVDDNYVIKHGETVEFYKPSGRKGKK